MTLPLESLQRGTRCLCRPSALHVSMFRTLTRVLLLQGLKVWRGLPFGTLQSGRRPWLSSGCFEPRRCTTARALCDERTAQMEHKRFMMAISMREFVKDLEIFKSGRGFVFQQARVDLRDQTLQPARMSPEACSCEQGKSQSQSHNLEPWNKKQGTSCFQNLTAPHRRARPPNCSSHSRR